MAYNNQSSGNRFGNRGASQSSGQSRSAGNNSTSTKKKDALILTGLFPTNPEKTKAVASVITEIPADVKAGQRVYVDLFKNSDEEVAAGKPLYRLRITPAPEAKRA